MESNLTVTPENMKGVSFERQFEGFVSLTEQRAELEGRTKKTAAKLKQFVQANCTDDAHGLHANDVERFVTAYEEPKPVAKELDKFANQYGGGRDRLATLLSSDTASKLIQNRIGATAFKALQKLLTEAEEARNDGSKKVDKKKTAELRKEYRGLLADWTDAESELEEISGKIAGIKEQVDMADKIANIGSKLKKR